MNKHTIKYLAAFLAFVLFLTAYIPGVQAGSKFSPGTFSPGTFSPGTFDPGQFDPGTFSPGTFDPGEFDPGTSSPGTVDPGDADSGDSSPGKGSPGSTAPGQFTPDDFNFESNFDHDKLEGGDPDASGNEHGSSEQPWKLPGYEGGNESNDYQNPSLKEFLTDGKHIKDYLSRVGKGLKDTGKGLWDDAANTAGYLFSDKFASDVKSGFNDGYDFIANGGLKKKLSEGLDYVSSGKMLADAKGKASEWGDSGKRVAKYLFSKDSVKDFGDYVFSGEIAMDFAEDFEAFATGVDPETKERIGGGQRFLSLAGIAVKPVKVLDKAGKIADAGNKANKKANLADNGKKDRGKAAVASKDDSKSSDKDQIPKLKEPAAGDNVGNGLRGDGKDTVKIPSGFADRAKLDGHFDKHGKEFDGLYKNADEYLEGAKEVINNGIKVKYEYKDEIRTGYVKFMGNNKNGKAKFEFVGTNNNGDITTYHTQSGKKIWKTINGENIPVINPAE
ncbi:hypothetical protein [Bacillus infantis]|uniref:hypothetical protein n=1 Tax=Bacillus infantis TaxID=324767 RepID=UPI003CE70B68